MMPHLALPALVATALAAAVATTPHPAPAPAPSGVTLTVVVTGLGATGGTVGAALFSTPEGFPAGTPTAGSLLHPHTTAAADTFTFRNVPPGRYAVAVQHDLNGNGAVDRTLFGAPKEPWGVSRDIRHSMRAPRFDEAAFDLRADLRIDVRVAR